MSKRAVLWWGFVLLVVFGAIGCSDGTGAKTRTSELATERGALTVLAQHDFEDGSLKGWIPRGPVTLTNTTEAAFDGTHSLKTTGRTSGFHGPSLNVFGVLTRGATYEISVKARLVAGEAPTTLRMTMQQTPTGQANQFIPVASANATDGAWVTLTGTFSYTIDVTGLLLYVEATSTTASYYIDSFSITETIPPPAVSILNDFENGTTQGWAPRGPVALTNTTEAAADGVRSLKTTGRTAGFHGPSLNVLGVLRKGATYQVSVKARLVTGEVATTLRVTVQRTPTGQSSAFDSVASASATDAAFVTMSGVYSFATDNTGLL
ncbi:MAG TPA: carbohydrate binding domain-containing protein, partial [Polyangiaceae bacterium]